MRTVLRTALAVIVASIALVGAVPAMAQPTDSANDDTNVTLTPGLLTIDGGDVEDLGSHTLTGAAFPVTGDVDLLTVTDSRGSGDGWTVTAQATQFKQHDGTAYVTSGRTLPESSTTLEGLDSATGQNDTQSAAPGLVLGPLTVDDDGAVVLASAGSNAGMGVFDMAFPADALTLSVPGDAYAATYRSDVTYTVVTGPAGEGAGLRWK